MGNRYIVVTVGPKPGVYPSWEDAAPYVLGISGAVWKGYGSETEAYTAYGRATVKGEKRILGADGSDETLSQPSAGVKKQERQSQAVSAKNDTKAGIKGEDSLGEIVVQCPPVSSSRHHSTIERASTLPLDQPPNSSNHPVRRSKTAPNLDSRSIPSTPKKSPAPNVGRSRVISISTDGCTTEEETIPSSPATNVSCTLSPTFGHHFPSSPPRETTPSLSSPARKEEQGDESQTRRRRRRSGTREDRQNYQTPIARPVRGSESPAHTTSALPSTKATNTSGIPVQSTTRRGTSHRPQPTKKVVWGSSSSANRPPSVHERGVINPISHFPRDRTEGRPRPSPGGSSPLAYVSDDERPAARPTHLVGDSDYYTPSSWNSEMSDADSEPPRRIPSSTSKQKGKRRASPLPPSSQDQGSSPSPSLSIDSSPRSPNSASGPSHKKRRDRYSHLPSPVIGASCREQTQPQDPGRSISQDVCHCTGPCPCCHKPRFPPPLQPHPFMYHPGYYPYPYFPPPQMQTGYPPTHYGPPPYPYPYPMPQQSDLLPSISSAQPPPPPSGYPMPPTLVAYPPTAYSLNAPVRASPAPTSSTPAPTPFTSSPIPPPSLVDSPREDPPATEQVSPELLEALGQFYQPQQRPVMVIDASYDPRSPYSKQAAVPAFPNSPIVLGRPGTPLSPLKGLGLAL